MGRQLGSLFSLRWLEKKQTHFQPKQDPGVCGPAAEEMDPGGFRSWSTGAERTQGLVQKWHKCMHAHTQCAAFSRQATVILVEKYGNRCIKAQDFEGLQGHGGIKDRPGGNRGSLLRLMCSSTHPEKKDKTNMIWEWQCVCVCTFIC